MNSNIKRELTEKAIRDIMGTPGGRRVMWWIRSLGNVEGNVWGANAAETARLVGKRDLAMQVMAAIWEIDPQAYNAMVAEGLAEEAQIAQGEK